MAQRKLRIVPLFSTDDLADNRIVLGNGFSIEDIRGLLSAQSFQPWQRRISEEEMAEIMRWDLCIVHEFSSDLVLGPEEKRSELMTRFLVASLRWLHPTQTHDGWFVQGVPRDAEPFNVHEFSHRPAPVFLEDCEARSGLAKPTTFSEATSFMNDFDRITDSILTEKFAFNPIVIAVRLSEQASLDFHPELRLLKRVMALEALFSSGNLYGKQAPIPRISEFLGDNTPIYDRTPTYTVGSVIRDMCSLRNAFAHGNIVPSQFVNTPPEPAIASTNVKSYADVLREASAVVLRSALLKIFRTKMVDDFSDKQRMEGLFESG